MGGLIFTQTALIHAAQESAIAKIWVNAALVGGLLRHPIRRQPLLLVGLAAPPGLGSALKDGTKACVIVGFCRLAPGERQSPAPDLEAPSLIELGHSRIRLVDTIGLASGTGEMAASSPYRAVQRATGISSVSTTCHPRHRALAFPRRNHGLTQWRSIRGGRASGRAAC